MEDRFILAGNSEERNPTPRGKVGLQNQLGHWHWSGSRWMEGLVLSFSAFHAVQEPRPWDVASLGSSLFSPWKHPHRYTQLWASLKLYVFLHPIKLKIEINNHRPEQDDLLVISQQIPSNWKVVPTTETKEKNRTSTDLIFSSVLIQLSWYSGTHSLEWLWLWNSRIHSQL